MLLFIEQMSGLEMVFAGCAVFGTALFIMRMILMFVGHTGDSDVDGHDIAHDIGHDMTAGDADAGHDFSGHDVSETDVSFRLLSLQGITAFFMMFGLVGWGVLRSGDHHPLVPIECGAAAGLLTVWVMKKIFQYAGMLQSSGTLNLQNAVGQDGTVYLTIKAGQPGKVQVTVQQRLSVLEAVAEDGQEIKTGRPVRVVKVTAGRLVVKKLES